MSQLRSKKKARFSADPTIQDAPEETILRKCHLARLPLELLAEVLSYMRSSRDVLALSRTSKHFREILVDNPATDFIWREARARCSTGPIPDPLPGLSEARYAAFLYNSGRCEICNKKTSRPYHSVSLRVRTCDTMKCQDTWRRSHSRILSAHEQEEYSDILRWIPRMELQDETADPIVHVRLSDWNQALNEYKEAKLLGPDALSEYLQKKQALADTMPERMEWYTKVTAWMTTLQKKRKLFTEIALTCANDHASILGCTRYELLHLPTYSIAHHAKIRCEERWALGEFDAVKGTVVAEMDAAKARKQHRILESIKRGRRADVKSEYARMKFEEDPTKPLPSLPEFRSLSIVKAVEGSTTPQDPKLSNPFVASVLKDNLEQWLDNARTSLAAVLGFPGWKTMSRRKLHPVDRLTARFRCKKCDAAGKDTGLDGGMDFACACAHVCPLSQKAQKKQKRQWSAEKFVPDRRAIDAISQALDLCGTRAEDADSLKIADSIGDRIQCVQCSLSMNVRSVARHCRRHEETAFTLLSESDSAVLPAPQYGLAAQLLGKSSAAAADRDKKIYVCRLCLASLQSLAAGASTTQVDGQSGIKATPPQKQYLTFNGLRSHLKGRHQVVTVADEDFVRRTEAVGSDGT